MLNIETLNLGVLKTNCYLVWEPETMETAIIDPADGADLIIQTISQIDLVPKYVIATHGHFDHNLASTEIVLAYQTTFAASPKDAFLLGEIAKSAAYWLKLVNEPALKAPPITTILDRQTALSLGKEVFTIIETPGHTPGSICLYNLQNNLLFSGDTLFHQAIGRTDLSYSSADDLKESLQLILQLPPGTVVYPGHGQTTTIGGEKTKLKL
ncbi:MBL fold metallo-hydrolase [Patescibacteria group bacterium]|nr:MBL fold metallo-hydrolase [Patescibacteria group bacterium]